MTVATVTRPMLDLTADEILTEDVAKVAREFAREQGIPVGTRGRLSVEHFARYFKAEPATARELAHRFGIEISKRGRLSMDDALKVAEVVR